ncbi:MAG TPA: hypothetical protein VN840_05140 [Streptosporangiaceae bacterium]|nr:hypothetical protein [Streptosporangiaceae bacterium]
MDNMYSPSDGSPENRTQPYSLGPDGLPETPATGQLLGQGGDRHTRGRSGGMTRWAAGLGIAALLIGGGSFVGVRLTSGGSPAAAANTIPGSGSQAARAAQAGALSAMLGTPASLSASLVSGNPAASSAPAAATGALHRCAAAARHLLATGHPGAARATWRFCAGRLLRLRLLLAGLHGQITVQTRDGVRTIAFERGVVQSVSGGAVVVKAADGTTWTWDLIHKTVVVQAGRRTGSSALATGQRVFAAGPVAGGANDARLIVIRG